MFWMLLHAIFLVKFVWYIKNPIFMYDTCTQKMIFQKMFHKIFMFAESFKFYLTLLRSVTQLFLKGHNFIMFKDKYVIKDNFEGSKSKTIWFFFFFLLLKGRTAYQRIFIFLVEAEYILWKYKNFLVRTARMLLLFNYVYLWSYI